MYTMKELLTKIAVKGTENRYIAILDILDDLNISYRIQEKIYKHSYPIYEEETHQMSFFDEDTFLNGEENDSCEEEEEDIDIEEEYEILRQIADEAGVDVIDETLFNSRFPLSAPKIIGYDSIHTSVKNIIVSLKDYCLKDNDKKIVLCAHYDAVTGSIAANDNGSSVAILIAFINEVMKSKTNTWFEIVFLDKEETGGTGCKQYIDEFRDEICEVINLDTCGVGNSIVVCDYSTHLNTDTEILVEKEMKQIYDVVEVDMLPYCDTDIFKRNNFDIMTICTFPEEDMDVIRGLRFYGDDKKEILLNPDNPIAKRKLSSYSSLISTKFFKMHIYKYMHNGERDNIDWINYELMNRILGYLKLLL